MYVVPPGKLNNMLSESLDMYYQTPWGLNTKFLWKIWYHPYLAQSGGHSTTSTPSLPSNPSWYIEEGVYHYFHHVSV